MRVGGGVSGGLYFSCLSGVVCLDRIIDTQ